ncbi:MAG: hydrogenase maturation protease [Terracidiphilus sp.]|jgi:hydrogenase maturation protease
MTQPQARCLILACGNTLRGDDGVGLWLAGWAERRFTEQAGVRIIARQQWTPELAEDVARAESVLFIDCSVDSAPGSIQLISVEPAAGSQGLATHHSGAAELLALARDLFNSLPRNAQLLTIGAGSTELGEIFSEAVQTSLPEACRLIEKTARQMLS